MPPKLVSAQSFTLLAAADVSKLPALPPSSAHIKRERSILDSVHGEITLPSYCWTFIDTEQFQRLRNIKQLGASYYVFPGGSHNRFEHCLGVAHLAHRMVLHLSNSQPELRITEREIRCVTLAGLCHDLGHGPFSHVFDGIFIPQARPGYQWSHEDASVMMLDALVQDPDNQINMPKEDLLLIHALIKGTSLSTEKSFLFQIVANKISGLDVDKLDYIARDSSTVGIKTTYSLSRIFEAARPFQNVWRIVNLSDSHTGVVQGDIAYDIKDGYNIYELFHSRFSLHHRVYNHKTGKAVELMIIDALLAADKEFDPPISSRIDDPSLYLHLTDSILEEIMASKKPGLARSQEIIKRLRTRNLYQLVDKSLIQADLMAGWDKNLLTSAHVAAQDPQLKEEDIIVCWSKLNFGMGKANPMDSVRFWSKTRPNAALICRPDQLTWITPSVFEEVMLRCYTKTPQTFGACQSAFRAARQLFAETNGQVKGDVPLNGEIMPTLRFDNPPKSPVNTYVITEPNTPEPTLSFESATKNRKVHGEGSIIADNDFVTVPKDFRGLTPSQKKRNDFPGSTDTSPASSMNKHSEIEAKRQKLAQLRKAREDRNNALLKSTLKASAPEHDLPSKDELIAEGVTIAPDSRSQTPANATEISAPGTPASLDQKLESNQKSLEHESGNVSVQTSVMPAPVETQVPVPKKIMYNKEVQTSDEGLYQQLPQKSEDSEQLIRARLLKEQQEEREKLAKNIEAAKIAEAKLEQEIINSIKDLSSSEREVIYAAPEFSAFVDQASKVIERVLNDDYDPVKNYSTISDSNGNDEDKAPVKHFGSFYSLDVCKNRSITAIEWSYKFPELCAVAYNRNTTSLSEPEGLVAIWNMHLAERPEYVFHAQSDVTAIAFSPFHSNIIIGGTYAGQVLIWDTRAKSLPVLKTPLSGTGHTHPIYSIKVIGNQNSCSIISSSTDGHVCCWLMDLLAEPQESLELTNFSHAKTSEVGITSMSFMGSETGSFFIGCEDGNIYNANRHDRAGAKAGLNQDELYRGHSAPVTGLDFHPIAGSIDFTEYFLSSSVDWTIKLWRARNNEGSRVGGAVDPICSFEESDDYVYDVKWHPSHPAIFASVNGSGKLDIWNLNSDTDIPKLSMKVGTGRALNKITWDKNGGKRLSVGGTDGVLHVYSAEELAVTAPTDWSELQKTISNLNSSSKRDEALQ